MSTRGLRIAYLVNTYPMPSMTFVRREIAAMEALGHQVARFTVRRDHTLIDPKDLEEASKTRCILQAGALRLLLALLVTAATRLPRFLRAWRLTMALRRRSARGLVVHLAYLAEACVLRNWLGQERPDHLHVHFATNSAAVAMLCRVLGGPPYSVTVHGPEEFDAAASLAFDEKIGHSKFFAAISDYGRSQLMRWCDPSQWSKLQVVRCGIDASFFDQPKTAIDPAPRLVCVGRLSRQKGQVFLVQAAAQLHDEGRQFQLVLVGDGETRAQIEAEIAQRGLQHVVTLTGVATGDAVREQILASRALILPSFAEGLPVVIMEALALHRPVLSTYVAGIPELVVPGESGWLVPAGAVAPLVAAMRAILDATPAELEQVASRGAVLVARHHDIRKIARQLTDLILAP